MSLSTLTFDKEKSCAVLIRYLSRNLFNAFILFYQYDENTPRRLCHFVFSLLSIRIRSIERTLNTLRTVPFALDSIFENEKSISLDSDVASSRSSSDQGLRPFCCDVFSVIIIEASKKNLYSNFHASNY